MATDDFNRANGAIGANWTTQTGDSALAINTNAAAVGDAFNPCGAIYTGADPTDGDHSSQATVGAIAGRIQAVRVRCQAGDETYYAAGKQDFELNNNDRYTIWKVVAGTTTELAVHGSQDMQVGDEVRLEVDGTTLTLFVNDTQILQTTDADISGGSWGLGLYELNTTQPSWDDWEGLDVGGGGGGGLSIPIVMHHRRLMGMS